VRRPGELNDSRGGGGSGKRRGDFSVRWVKALASKERVGGAEKGFPRERGENSRRGGGGVNKESKSKGIGEQERCWEDLFEEAKVSAVACFLRPRYQPRRQKGTLIGEWMGTWGGRKRKEFSRSRRLVERVF